MTNENNAIVNVSNVQIAQADKVPNVNNIESKLNSYGGVQIPVTVTFHQSFKRKVKESYRTMVDELQYETKTVDGKEIKEPVYEIVTKTIAGKPVQILVQKTTGKKVMAKKSFDTGETREDQRRYDVRFLCSDAKDLRHKIGEAFNEIKTVIEAANPFVKNEMLHSTFNINGKVLSTKYLLLGGVKISKLFVKGKFQSDKFSEEFCKPLFNQLQTVEKGENNKPLEVDDLILSVIGLKKEAKKETKK